MKSIILASTSPYRKAQLEELGIPLRSHAPAINEDLYKNKGLSPEALASTLSQKKAESIAEQFPEDLIVGGDQVVEVEGTFLSKPGTKEAAYKQLALLEGRSHHLWSGVAVHSPKQGKTHVAVEKHTLTMRSLTSSQIKRYVDEDEPWFCAGSYRVESKGIMLFSSIQGNDHTAIVGLPILRLIDLLEQFDVHPFTDGLG